MAVTIGEPTDSHRQATCCACSSGSPRLRSALTGLRRCGDTFRVGFKCALLGLSPRIPREDITTHSEGGPDAAIRFVEGAFPGQFELEPETVTFDECANPTGGEIAVGTWGDTVLLAIDDPFTASDRVHAAGDTRHAWILMVHSVVDACGYVTPPAYGDRQVGISGDSNPEELTAALTGSLLPFEEPFVRGDHAVGDDEYPMPYHPLALGDAAVAWMFGTMGESPNADEVMDALKPIEPWELPMHVFYPKPAARAKGFFARLLGR